MIRTDNLIKDSMQMAGINWDVCHHISRGLQTKTNAITIASSLLLSLFTHFIYFKGRGTEPGEIIHSQVYSPDVGNSQGWRRLKSGAGNSNQIFPVGGRDPTPWTIIWFLVECSMEGSWNGRWGQALKLSAHKWNVGAPKGDLTPILNAFPQR